ncbi:MAG TPA: prolipoprotein diacylglyceryl transferase family protein [Kofleriaceae bacterium]|nr:prolipoprotein diacylglyceryl transferase family protein [Kofleriaceae bacterium]
MRFYVLHWLEGYMRGDIANLVTPSWFTCVGLAGLVGLIVMLALARRRGLDSGAIATVLLVGYVAAVVAGIVVPMMIDCAVHLVTTGHFQLHWAGMTSFWGYLAGGVAVVVVCRREGLPLARVADLAVIPLGIALMFARLGCFMAGCDYGKVSSVPWAVRFPAGSPAWHDHVRAGLVPASRAESLPVHPTQLYEAALGIAIVVIAIVLSRRKRSDGQLFVIAAATYAIGRLVIETVRGDAGRGIYAGLSSGQIFSMLVLLAIAMRFLVTRRRVVTAVATAAFVLAIANVGEADAQPVPEVELQPPSATPPLDWAERPQYSTGILVGVATPLNRRADQVPTLAGPSVSLGYLPGRFGVWLDFDTYANSEATHGTFLIAGSFTQRLTPRLTIGGRLGIGATEVNFKEPAFRDVVATTLRAELISEIVLARHWAIWVRPLTIDTLSSAELGGPITTYQFRIGFAYRFGSRHNAVPVQPLPPLGTYPPPPGPPSLPPDPPIGAL